MHTEKSLIELPGKGKALIVTDIHGNFPDFSKYMEIWNKFRNKNNHFILTGDFIHGRFSAADNSIKILETVIKRSEQQENFHVLLGNHEWSHVSGEGVYKSGINQKAAFESLVSLRFFGKWKNKLNSYIDFFKKLPLAIKTKNGVFISHAAPVKNINSITDIMNIKNEGYGRYNKKMYEILWNRHPKDYDEKDVDVFLRKVGCKFAVVGHTQVNCCKIIGKQIILSSSTSSPRSSASGSKCYIELDLEKNLVCISELVEMIKHLQ